MIGERSELIAFSFSAVVAVITSWLISLIRFVAALITIVLLVLVVLVIIVVV